MNISYRLAFCLLIMAHMVSCSQATLAKRNKLWNPKSGKYYFDTQLTWAYQNDLASEEFYRKGEISIYVDEVSGTFLFTKEAYGWSGEMVDFVIADQKGKYIFGYTDEFGGKFRETKQLEKFQEIISLSKEVANDFKKKCIPSGKSKRFGINDFGWPVNIGKEYIMSYDKTNDKNILYLSNSKYGFLPVFLFNRLESEAKLPVSFDYSNILPNHYIILQDEYQYNNQIVKLTFLSSSPTEYFIDTNEYKSIK